MLEFVDFALRRVLAANFRLLENSPQGNLTGLTDWVNLVAMVKASKRAVGPRDPTRRRRILVAAKQQFTAHGFRGTQLAAVAEAAGCAKGALYLEFSDKAALLREVVGEVYAAVHARYAAEVLALPSPHQRLVETLRFAYKMMAAEPLFSRLMREDPELSLLRPPADQAAQLAAAKAQIDQLIAWVDEGIAAGEMRPSLDREALPFVIGLLRFVPQHMATLAGLIAEDRVLRAIVDIFAAGLAATSTPSPSPKPTPRRRSSS